MDWHAHDDRSHIASTLDSYLRYFDDEVCRFSNMEGSHRYLATSAHRGIC